MKRYVVLGIMICILITCCGCNIFMPELSAADFDKVAEYAAYVLLNDADGYESKLISEEEVQRIQEERALQEKIEQEMEALNKPGYKPPVDDKDDPVIDNNDKPSDNPSNPDENDNAYTLNDMFAIDGVDIQYAGYEIADVYPETSDAAFVVKATSGNKLIVLSFVMQNNNASQTECNLFDRDISYRLSINSGGTYKSLLTVFENDISTWNKTLAPGEVNIAILIFQVPEEFDESNISELKFTMREDGTSRSVILN